jgi:hypothetical protein
MVRKVSFVPSGTVEGKPIGKNMIVHEIITSERTIIQVFIVKFAQ